MMTSLFSIFEPSSNILLLPLNWMSTFIGLLFMPMMYWSSLSRWLYLWTKMLKILHKELKSLLTNFHLGTTLIFISLFSLIVFNNSLGLLPYIFTSSSHLAMTLSLSLPIWVTLMIFGWYKRTQHMFAHLVPQGTPKILMPFMVIIETISNLIRPGTLAVRLTANMIAGHLLLTLLGQTGPQISTSSTLLFILIFSQILLLMLESAVAVIQSYVFVVLSTLYTGEIN